MGRPTKRYTIQQIQKHPWYLKDLPPGVIQMNNECLKLRNHSSGFQSDTEIQNIVMQAIGTTHSTEDDNDYCDDVIVSPSFARSLHSVTSAAKFDKAAEENHVNERSGKSAQTGTSLTLLHVYEGIQE